MDRFALVLRIEWAPNPWGSSPIRAAPPFAIREYCPVDRCGDPGRPLGNKNRSGPGPALATHVATASRVCSVSLEADPPAGFLAATNARKTGKTDGA